jgi:hypothetical protein
MTPREVANSPCSEGVKIDQGEDDTPGVEQGASVPGKTWPGNLQIQSHAGSHATAKTSAAKEGAETLELRHLLFVSPEREMTA